MLSIVNTYKPGYGIEVLQVLLVGTILCGCYQRQEFKTRHVSQEEVSLAFGDKPAILRSYYEGVLKEGQRNSVLNYMRLGLRAMELGLFEDTEQAFDHALNGIEAIYANNKAAIKARSLYYEEGAKDFKGEPYERCMAYYYRGLLYMFAGDYENARACFKAGILQDAFAEEEQNRCDFALLIFLEGWTFQQLGDTDAAEASYAEVKKLRPDFIKPSIDNNVLVLVETGTSPRKVADGMGHSELKFRRGRNFTEKRVRIVINDSSPEPLFPMEDVARQAMTRGGRAVDKILEGKVEFRKTNEQVGTILTDVSSEAMLSAPLWGDNMEAVQGISAAVGVVGAMQMVMAANAKPHADTRYWDNLPDGVHTATMTIKPGMIRIQGEFFTEDGVSISELVKKKDIKVNDNGSTLIWLRSREG